jgi:hypothetical protein
MDLILLIHPVIAASAVLTVVTAYLLKTRKRQYFRLHYAAGILAFSLSMVAFALGLYFVLINGGPTLFPEAILFHTANFVVAIGLIVFQGALGMGMLLFGRTRSDFRSHKRAAKYVLFVFLVQGALGLLTLYGILPFVFG